MTGVAPLPPMSGEAGPNANGNAKGSSNGLIKVEELFGSKGGLGEVGRRISEYDTSGDGYLSKDELRAAFAQEIQLKKTNTELKKIICAALVLVIILLLGVFAMTFAVVELSKETSTNSNSGVMTVPGSDTVVKVGQSLESKVLSSLLPTAAFFEMRYMQITSPTGAELQFFVLQVARIPDEDSLYGTVIRIYTHSGHLTLDGDAMTFSFGLTDVFEEAGFRSTGRRLLGAVELIGFFNTVSGVDADGLNNTDIKEVEHFYSKIRVLESCVRQASSDDDSATINVCKTASGTYITQDIVTFEGAEYLEHTEEAWVTPDGIYTEKFFASTSGVVLATYVNRTLEDDNTTDIKAYQWQKYSGAEFHCREISPQEAGWLDEDAIAATGIQTINGEAYTDDPSDGTFVYHGVVDGIVDGYEVRKFTLDVAFNATRLALLAAEEDGIEVTAEDLAAVQGSSVTMTYTYYDLATDHLPARYDVEDSFAKQINIVQTFTTRDPGEDDGKMALPESFGNVFKCLGENHTDVPVLDGISAPAWSLEDGDTYMNTSAVLLVTAEANESDESTADEQTIVLNVTDAGPEVAAVNASQTIEYFDPDFTDDTGSPEFRASYTNETGYTNSNADMRRKLLNTVGISPIRKTHQIKGYSWYYSLRFQNNGNNIDGRDGWIDEADHNWLKRDVLSDWTAPAAVDTNAGNVVTGGAAGAVGAEVSVLYQYGKSQNFQITPPAAWNSTLRERNQGSESLYGAEVRIKGTIDPDGMLSVGGLNGRDYGFIRGVGMSNPRKMIEYEVDSLRSRIGRNEETGEDIYSYKCPSSSLHIGTAGIASVDSYTYGGSTTLFVDNVVSIPRCIKRSLYFYDKYTASMKVTITNPRALFSSVSLSSSLGTFADFLEAHGFNLDDEYSCVPRINYGNSYISATKLSMSCSMSFSRDKTTARVTFRDWEVQLHKNPAPHAWHSRNILHVFSPMDNVKFEVSYQGPRSCNWWQRLRNRWRRRFRKKAIPCPRKKLTSTAYLRKDVYAPAASDSDSRYALNVPTPDGYTPYEFLMAGCGPRNCDAAMEPAFPNTNPHDWSVYNDDRMRAV